MTNQKLLSSKEIQKEIETDEMIKQLKDNYDNYSKRKACTEKSKCWLCPYRYSGNIEEARFSEEDLKLINQKGNKMIKEAAEIKDYITKDELIERAKTLGINTTPGSFNKLLADYKEAGLIEPSIMKSKASLGILGERGTVGFYKKNTPEMIYVIKEMLKQSCTLQDIKKYKDTIYEFKEDLACYFKPLEVNEIERSKFRATLTYFACAEANLKDNLKFYSLINVVVDNDKKIKEIHVILKYLSMPEIWDSIEQVEKRLAADLVLLKHENKMIYSLEDLDVLYNNLKTIKEVIFKAGSIEVL